MLSENDTDGHRKKLYVAAPLFSAGEIAFNKRLKEMLSRYFDVFLPQEDGGLMTELIKQGKSDREAAEAVFKADVRAIAQADVLLIVLDGSSVDEGAAIELGIAYALGKDCYGLQTDMRRLLPTGNNPMISCSIRRVFHTIEDLVLWANEQSQVCLQKSVNPECLTIVRNGGA